MSSPRIGAGRVFARIAASIVLLASFPWLAAAQPTWVPNEIPGINGTDACVNDAGQIAGYRRMANFVDRAVLRMPDGAIMDLGTIGGDVSNGLSNAFDINALGHVAGKSADPPTFSNHAFLWTPQAGMIDLGAFLYERLGHLQPLA